MRIANDRINLKDGFAQIKNGYLLSNVHIAPYEEGNIESYPERRRKLLLHKSTKN